MAAVWAIAVVVATAVALEHVPKVPTSLLAEAQGLDAATSEVRSPAAAVRAAASEGINIPPATTQDRARGQAEVVELDR